MQQNVEPADRYLRLAAGLASLSSAVYGRHQSALTKTLLAGFGVMKIAEAITGYCPIKATLSRARKPQAMERASQRVQQAATQAASGVKELAGQAKQAAAQAAQHVQSKAETAIPDEVAEFLKEGTKRETSDEDNA
ncbi:YgaP family membrane protein [Alicyclobacillus vulcanalis]|uniref:Inner membrane protein YgaP-like transmembrane domain-containing protein n=1 Tax=Alicyclobacillus vulcanalis TaxID=252246 RepID=A0A1N7NP25_9BACL|nr:DUF2892 domain-containing protein [Alicyclobacillus vulcanalis]SIS99969.1 Protein of unknown function [Alicyclobacillus vulcanalis]